MYLYDDHPCYSRDLDGDSVDLDDMTTTSGYLICIIISLALLCILMCYSINARAHKRTSTADLRNRQGNQQTLEHRSHGKCIRVSSFMRWSRIEHRCIVSFNLLQPVQ